MKKSINQTLTDNKKVIFNSLEECDNLGIKIPNELKKALVNVANSQEDIKIDLTDLRNTINFLL